MLKEKPVSGVQTSEYKKSSGYASTQSSSNAGSGLASYAPKTTKTNTASGSSTAPAQKTSFIYPDAKKTITPASVLASIMTVTTGDKERGESAYGYYKNLVLASDSPIWKCYDSPTSTAIGLAQESGLDVSGGINDDWFAKNAGLKNYYTYSDTSNGVVSPGTKASTEQKQAYAYYQVYKDYETTKTAQQELEALNKEVAWWTNHSANYSDEEIKGKIDWSKYPTLTKMDDGRKAGVPIGLTSAVSYNQDTVDGMIWAARNGDGKYDTSDNDTNAVRYYLQQGNGYVADETIAAKLAPGTATYAPYSVGSTMSDVAMGYGVYSFDKEWATSEEGLAHYGETDYAKVVNAEEFTAQAESELETFWKRVDSRIEKGIPINESLFADLDGLNKMEESLSTGKLVSTTREIGYTNKADMLAQAEKKAAQYKIDNMDSLTDMADAMGGSIKLPKNNQMAGTLAVLNAVGDDATIEQIAAGDTKTLEMVAGFAKSGNVDMSKVGDMTIGSANKFAKETYFPALDAKADYEDKQEELKTYNDRYDAFTNALKPLTDFLGTDDLDNFDYGGFVGTFDPDSYRAMLDTQKREAEEDAFFGDEGAQERIAEIEQRREKFDEVMGVVNLGLYAGDNPVAKSEGFLDVMGEYRASGTNAAETQRWLDENKAGYDEALDNIQTLDDMFTTAMTAGAMGDGVTKESIRTAMDVVWELGRNYTPKNYSAYTLGQAYAEANATQEQITENFTQSIASIDAEIAAVDKAVEMLKNSGVDIPESYVKNLDSYKESLNARRTEMEYWLLRNNEDFKENSVIDESTEDGKSFINDYVNSIPGGLEQYKFMDDGEKATLHYLWKTQGRSAASQYWDSLNQTLEVRQSAQMMKAAGELGENIPLLSSAATVFMSPLKIVGAAYVGAAGVMGVDVDPYSQIFWVNNFTTSVRQSAKQEISTMRGVFGEDSAMAWFMGAIYDGMISRADSLMNGYTFGFGDTALGNVLSPAPMALSGAADTFRQCILNGDNMQQAWIKTAASFAGEYLTEVIEYNDIRALMSGAISYDSIIAELLGDARNEAIGEMLGQVIEQSGELITGDYTKEIEAYREEHRCSTEEATRAVFAEKMYEVFYAGVTAAIGSVLGGGAQYAATNIMTTQEQRDAAMLEQRNAQREAFINQNFGTTVEQFDAEARSTLDGLQNVSTDGRTVVPATYYDFLQRCGFDMSGYEIEVRTDEGSLDILDAAAVTANLDGNTELENAIRGIANQVSTGIGNSIRSARNGLNLDAAQSRISSLTRMQEDLRAMVTSWTTRFQPTTEIDAESPNTFEQDELAMPAEIGDDVPRTTYTPPAPPQPTRQERLAEMTQERDEVADNPYSQALGIAQAYIDQMQHDINAMEAAIVAENDIAQAEALIATAEADLENPDLTDDERLGLEQQIEEAQGTINERRHDIEQLDESMRHESYDDDTQTATDEQTTLDEIAQPERERIAAEEAERNAAEEDARLAAEAEQTQLQADIAAEQAAAEAARQQQEQTEAEVSAMLAQSLTMDDGYAEATLAASVATLDQNADVIAITAAAHGLMNNRYRTRGAVAFVRNMMRAGVGNIATVANIAGNGRGESHALLNTVMRTRNVTDEQIAQFLAAVNRDMANPEVAKDVRNAMDQAEVDIGVSTAVSNGEVEDRTQADNEAYQSAQQGLANAQSAYDTKQAQLEDTQEALTTATAAYASNPSDPVTKSTLDHAIAAVENAAQDLANYQQALANARQLVNETFGRLQQATTDVMNDIRDRVQAEFDARRNPEAAPAEQTATEQTTNEQPTQTAEEQPVQATEEQQATEETPAETTAETEEAPVAETEAQPTEAEQPSQEAQAEETEATTAQPETPAEATAEEETQSDDGQEDRLPDAWNPSPATPATTTTTAQPTEQNTTTVQPSGTVTVTSSNDDVAAAVEARNANKGANWRNANRNSSSDVVDTLNEMGVDTSSIGYKPLERTRWFSLKSATKAFKTVLKAARKSNRNDLMDVTEVTGKDGNTLYCVCDGFRAYRVNEAVPGVEPSEHEAETRDSRVGLFERIFEQNFKPLEDGTTVPLITPTIDAVKNVISTAKANKTSPIYVFGFGRNRISINAQYLLDAMALFPDAKFSAPQDNIGIRPIFLSGENGDACILPIRIGSLDEHGPVTEGEGSVESKINEVLFNIDNAGDSVDTVSVAKAVALVMGAYGNNFNVNDVYATLYAMGENVGSTLAANEVRLNNYGYSYDDDYSARLRGANASLNAAVRRHERSLGTATEDDNLELRREARAEFRSVLAEQTAHVIPGSGNLLATLTNAAAKNSAGKTTAGKTSTKRGKKAAATSATTTTTTTQTGEPPVNARLDGNGSAITARVQNTIANRNRTNKAIKSGQNIAQEWAQSIGVVVDPKLRNYRRNLLRRTLGYTVSNYGGVSTGVTHIRDAGDIWTAAHEIGHVFDEVWGLQSYMGQAQFNAMVVEMARRNGAGWVASYPAGALPGEAIAEFTNYYLQDRQDAVDLVGEDFVTRFEQFLAEHGALDATRKAAFDLHSNMEGTAAERAKAQINMRTPSQERFSMTNLIKKVDQEIFQKFSPMRHSGAMSDAEGNGITHNVYEMLKQMGNTSANMFTSCLCGPGLVDVEGNLLLDENGDAYGSLSDIFKQVSDKDKHDFNTYWVAKHALARESFGKHVFSQARGGTNAIHINPQEVLNEYGPRPEWDAVIDQAEDWLEAFMQTWMVDRGLLTQTELDLMREMYPFYIPTYRTGFANHGRANSELDTNLDMVQSATGGTQDIANPVANFVGVVQSYIQQVKRNEALRVFDERASMTRDFLGQVEILQVIPANPDVQMQPDQFGNWVDPVTGDPITNLERLQIQRGALGHVRRGANGEDVINIVRANGDVAVYRIYDPFIKTALEAQSGEQTHKLLRSAAKVMGYITRLVGRTATALNLGFIFPNVMSDTGTAMVTGHTGGSFRNLPQYAFNWITSACEYIVNYAKDQRGLDTSEAYRTYNLFGSIGSRWNIKGDKGIAKLEGELYNQSNVKKIVGKLRNASPVHWIEVIGEVGENITRYNEYTRSHQSLGTYEGRVTAGKYAREATVDFSQRGASENLKIFSSAFSFLNASLQGVYKTIDTFTAANAGNRAKVIASAIGNTALIATVMAILRGGWTDEEKEAYESLTAYERNKYWHVKLPDGTFLRIKKSQDALLQMLFDAGEAASFAIINGTTDGYDVNASAMLQSAAWEAVKGINPRQYIENFALAPLLQVSDNENWYGGKIEGYDVEDLPETQKRNSDTPHIYSLVSELVNSIGIKWSPLDLEYLTQQYGGSFGIIGADIIDGILYGNDTALQAAGDAMVDYSIGKFTVDPAYSNSVCETFYAQIDRLNEIKESAKDGLSVSAFSADLTKEEATEGVQLANAMLAKGGIVYETKAQIKELWAQHDAVQNDESLTSEQKVTMQRQIRAKINRLAIEANSQVTEYFNTYSSGYKGNVQNALPAWLGGGNKAVPTSEKEGLPDYFKERQDEWYMDIAQSVYQETNKSSALPHPNSEFKKGDVEYTVPDDAWDWFCSLYEESYMTYLSDNEDKLYSATTAEERLEVMEAAHTKAQAYAKKQYLATYGE